MFCAVGGMYFLFARTIIVISNGLDGVKDTIYMSIALIFTFVAPIFIIMPAIGAESIILFMDKEKVWMNREISSKNERIQYKTETRFEDIADMKIIIDNRDSRSKSIQSRRSVSLKKYLVLLDQQGKENRFFVQWYTNKYLVKIMTKIVERIESTGTVYSGTAPQEVMDNYKQTERKKLL